MITCICVHLLTWVMYLLVLKLSGELILCLFKLLSGHNVFINDIFYLPLHQLQFGIQLYTIGSDI